jgi:hypothetical protein
MRIAALLAAACLLPASIYALGPDDPYPDIENSEPLSQTELRAEFTGKTHVGSYNFLNPNITTFAFEETTSDDGKIRHIQQGIVDTGQWEIMKNIICYDYDDPKLLQACFRMYLIGNCYYHYQVSAAGFPRYGFTARSVIKGDVPNCEPSYV